MGGMASAIYLSIGSNGAGSDGASPARMTQRAMEKILAMEGAGEIGRGRLYHTEPQGKTDQPWFVNTVLALRMQIEPIRLLHRLKDIEKELGRTSGERWGSRVIDIDIIFIDDVVMTTEELTIPHPLASQRRFVLAPLADIDPGLAHPVSGKTVAELLAALPADTQPIRLIDPSTETP